MASAVSPQPESVSRIRPRSICLGVVKISGDDQIEISITVYIIDDDSLDGCDLREIG